MISCVQLREYIIKFNNSAMISLAITPIGPPEPEYPRGSICCVLVTLNSAFLHRGGAPSSTASISFRDAK